MKLNVKKNLFVAITVLMVCVFSLVSCNILGFEIPFFSEDTTEASQNDTPATDGTKPGSQSSSDGETTTKPDADQTTDEITTQPSTSETPEQTTTKPAVTTPAIQYGGPNTEPGYRPIGDPVS